MCRQQATTRQEKHLPVAFQLRQRIGRVGQQTVHAPIIRLSQEIRNVVINKRGHIVGSLVINLRLDELRLDAGPPQLFDKVVGSLHQLVRS